LPFAGAFKVSLEYYLCFEIGKFDFVFPGKIVVCWLRQADVSPKQHKFLENIKLINLMGNVGIDELNDFLPFIMKFQEIVFHDGILN
jgi:hypothetical protein